MEILSDFTIEDLDFACRRSIFGLCCDNHLSFLDGRLDDGEGFSIRHLVLHRCARKLEQRRL